MPLQCWGERKKNQESISGQWNLKEFCETVPPAVTHLPLSQSVWSNAELIKSSLLQFQHSHKFSKTWQTTAILSKASWASPRAQHASHSLPPPHCQTLPHPDCLGSPPPFQKGGKWCWDTDLPFHGYPQEQSQPCHYTLIFILAIVDSLSIPIQDVPRALFAQPV